MKKKLKDLIALAFTLLGNPRYLALGVVGVSVFSLCTAWTAQYGFGLEPCRLCYLQRKPYMINIALGLIAFLLVPKNRKAALGVLYLAAFVFFANAVIAGHHVGVEQHWWQEIAACVDDALPQNASAEEIRQYIMRRKPVPCDQVPFEIFGISMAGGNLMFASLLAFVTAFFTRQQWPGK